LSVPTESAACYDGRHNECGGYEWWTQDIAIYCNCICHLLKAAHRSRKPAKERPLRRSGVRARVEDNDVAAVSLVDEEVLGGAVAAGLDEPAVVAPTYPIYGKVHPSRLIHSLSISPI
jgi:hypothetical protein